MCVHVCFPDFEPVLLQQKSQLHNMRCLQLPTDDQANQSFHSHKFFIKSFFSYHIEKFTGYSLNFIDGNVCYKVSLYENCH